MIAVLDYGIGNLRSAEKALQKVGGDARLTDSPVVASKADAVVLPGVGSFGACMTALRSTGLDQVALSAIDDGKPFLGICVGLQMLYADSEESPEFAGLGVLEGSVRRLNAPKLPQMQWNVLDVRTATPLLAGLDDNPWMYFVHSYAPEVTSATVATCHYGEDVTAMVNQDNVWATQFHPEKSSNNGLRLLENFVKLVTNR